MKRKVQYDEKEYRRLKTAHAKEILDRIREISVFSPTKTFRLAGIKSRSLASYWRDPNESGFPSWELLTNLGYITKTVPLLVSLSSREDNYIGINFNLSQREAIYDCVDFSKKIESLKKSFFRIKPENPDRKIQRKMHVYNLLKIIDNKDYVKSYQWLADIPREYNEFSQTHVEPESPRYIRSGTVIETGLSCLEKMLGLPEKPLEKFAKNLTLAQLRSVKVYSERMDAIVDRLRQINEQFLK